MGPFIALTDKAWFDTLSSRAGSRRAGPAEREGGRLDEVNFWSPRATKPLKSMPPGTPVFLRLKAPWNAIAGYGFFAHHTVLTLDQAWREFGVCNGDEHEASFLARLGRFRGLDLLDPRTPQAPLGCTVLRDAHFWPAEAWLPWGRAQGWAANIVRGAEETDPGRAALLLARIRADAEGEAVAEELGGAYRLVEGDERLRRAASVAEREGQGAFRVRLLDAYGRACAVTGEHTEPVLDAAHIQPYLGPRSNHIQNGILLTKEFHALFDLGLVTVTPDYVVRVSSALADRWGNGRRYREYHGRPLAQLPKRPAERPSAEALAWHNRRFTA